MWIPPRSESMKPKYSRRLANALTNCSPPTTPTTTTTTLTVLRPEGFAAGKKGAHLKEKREKEGPPHGTQRKEKSKKRGVGEKRNWKREEEESSDLPHWPLDLPPLLSLSLFLPFSPLTADFFLLAWVDLFFGVMQKKYRSFVFSLPFSCCRCCCERCIYCMYPTHLFPTTSFSLPWECYQSHPRMERGGRREESNHDAISREREAGICVVQCGLGEKTRTRTHDAFVHKNVACAMSEKWRKRSIIPFVGENCFLFLIFLRVHHLWEPRLLGEKKLWRKGNILFLLPQLALKLFGHIPTSVCGS